MLILTVVGFDDLGKGLKCGCSPLNYCLCDTKEAAAATSYINSCVNTKCALPNEVTAVLDLYNGYCLTANIAPATTSSIPYSFTGSLTKTTNAAGSEVTGQSVAKETGGAAAAAATSKSAVADTSSANANESSTPKSGGLSLGAIIGIAVGGIVLVAALLCAGCCMLWRRHKNKKNARLAGVGNQGFTAGNAVPETTMNTDNYISPVGGAAQLDGKPGVKVAETAVAANSLGGSTTVSPMQTPQPTPQPVAAATVHQTQQQVPPNTHEMYGHGQQQQLPPNTHEMYGTGNGQQQPNAHEVYGTGNSGQHPNAHEAYGSGGYSNGQHAELYGQQPHSRYSRPVYEKP